MAAINTLDEKLLSPDARRREVAALLALGLFRLRERNHQQWQKNTPEKQFVLGFSGNQSVHGNPSTRE